MITTILMLVFISGCTKSRKAELPEEQKIDIYALSEFGEVSENSGFEAKINSTTTTSSSTDANDNLNVGHRIQISSEDVEVPSRLKFMFNELPLIGLQNKQFKIVFSVDKEHVTAYKIATRLSDLSVLEKSIAMTLKEVQLLSKTKNSDINHNTGQSIAQTTTLESEKKSALLEKNEIKIGKKYGPLLVPLFKYKVISSGVLARTKNELKEETAKLELKKTDWKMATHIQISSRTDERLVIGAGAEQAKEFQQLFTEEKIHNQVMNSDELQSRLAVDMKFMDNKTKVLTRLGSDSLYIYEITNLSKLTKNQQRLFNNSASNEHVLSCSEPAVSASLKSTDQDCVLLLVASVPVTYKKATLTEIDESGLTSATIKFEDTQKVNSVGLVQIKEHVAAKQVEVSSTGQLDPNSTIKLSDLKGEFFYRRTFEAASNMFLGRTGTSGDMTIIRFELEDHRIVVRNQQSLIAYTGQGPKDREEMMSFPVKYFRMSNKDEHGNNLVISIPVETTKENAVYAQIDWTKNTVPDSNSPLAFYAGGDCFMANSNLNVADTDMRLATDGVLNYSLSASYTVKPTNECVVQKDVNSAYWAGNYQFNFNISERISFMKHKDANADIQFAKNISSMAQAAFNFGVFTLADKVTGNGTLDNRDGSEKYMPIIHDFRNGKKLKYYLGGINNPEATPPERRQLLIEATEEVIAEWNKVLRFAFKNTPLERTDDYVELVIDGNSADQKLGHLGDLDRNYIWLQELPAENGLLGVAQPAANPRSGTIQAANVIVYTGNTFNQTERLLEMTKLYRAYEKEVKCLADRAKNPAPESQDASCESLAQKNSPKLFESALQNIGSTKASPANTTAELQAAMVSLDLKLQQSINALQLNSSKINKSLTEMKPTRDSEMLKTIMTKDVFKTDSKGQIVNYKVDEETYIKKLADIASATNGLDNPNKFELEVNKAFLQFGTGDKKGIFSDSIKRALIKRSQLLEAKIRFDENMKNRPGCFSYSRDDANDVALNLDKDPKKNLMLNFKNNVKSTLSHELGHAFGLLHNFKASTDKANYEFKGETTGRNYSSIMDYIGDVDMIYKGPGPYDAHAIRAAYTGMVEVEVEKKDQLVSIDTIIKATNIPLVHLTKETLNQKENIAGVGTLKFFEQCDDTGTDSSVMCARFDSGGSATEIMKNLIADYHRGYIGRNYVYDKILFGWPQKTQLINRNIALFQKIRSFLDEAIHSLQFGTGLPELRSNSVIADQLKATKLGYTFFLELIRTPDAGDSSIMTVAKNEKDQTIEYKPNLERFLSVPYSYKDAQNKEVTDVKIVEARSVFDKYLNNTNDKIDSMGILYDKMFAMMFLLQSTSVQTKDDSSNSQISYIDFEQFLMGIKDPTRSPTMNTILKLFQNKLKVGFYVSDNTETKYTLTEEEFNAEVKRLQKMSLIEVDKVVTPNRQLSERTATGVIIGLAQSKWRSFDSYAEAFKISSSRVDQAPKDRPNVAKIKQDKSLSDTRVLFAPQNAVGSRLLINTAARNEYFIINKNTIFAKPIIEILNADMVYKKSISKLKELACEKGQDTPECIAALEKEDQDYIKENVSIAAEKAAADLLAQNFTKKLRELNATEVIIEAALDTETSSINLDHQVSILRELMIAQIQNIYRLKATLEDASAESIRTTIAEVVTELKQIREENSALESLPLLVTGFNIVADIGKNIPIKLQDGGVLSGATIANAAMNTGKLQNDLDMQLPILEKLATYSNLVDPDTSIR